MIEFAAGLADVAAVLGYRAARDALLDPRGRTVRCTPCRRTVMQAGIDGGPELFRKLRCDGGDAAGREWGWLQRLPELGFPTAVPVCFASAGRASAIVSMAAPGRPLSALLHAAPAAEAVEYACAVVAPMVSRLHGHGLVFRDLYWNHLFAESLGVGREPAFIDVERVFAPAWRWRRWVVKDLAGLVASWPEPGAAGVVGPALVHAYVGAVDPTGGGVARLGSGPGLVAAVLGKAQRIRARRPRYGA